MQQEKKVFPCVSENKTSGIDKTVPFRPVPYDLQRQILWLLWNST